MIHRIVYTILFLSVFQCLHAQQFGAFPPSTKWRQIDTDTVRIIYSAEAAEQAQRISTVLHNIAARTNPLGNKFNKINIVLHNRSTLANGYVGLAPFRSEFYLIPGGNIFEHGNLP